VLAIILYALNKLIWIIIVLIIARSLLSWFPGGSESRFGAFMVMMTEPILSPIRRLCMKFEFARSSPFDFSPMVAVLLLYLVQSIIGML
jgi:YggT family protein